MRSHGPRILRFRASPPPPPPEPDELEPPARAEPTAHEVIEEAAAREVVEAPADEIVEEPHEAIEAPADEIVEEPADEAVEAPADEIVEEPADEIVAEPVADEPVAPTGPLGRRSGASAARRAAPAPAGPASAARGGAGGVCGGPRREPEPLVPARRFARARPWPKDAETLWTCEIAWKAGYLKSTFRAMAGPPGAGRRKSIAESPSLRWTLMTDPEPPTSEMIASVKVLVSALVAAGWERAGSGAAWYAQRFVWRGSGEPGAVAVPDEIESAEQPPR